MKKLLVILVFLLGVGCRKGEQQGGRGDSSQPFTYAECQDKHHFCNTSDPALGIGNIDYKVAAPPSDKAEGPLTEAQMIGALRDIAKEKGWSWDIICTKRAGMRLSYGTDWDFQADAWRKGTTEPGGKYIEDGLQDWKAEHGSTQGQAALKLYRNIRDGGHSVPAEHKPKETHEYCPPRISGNVAKEQP